MTVADARIAVASPDAVFVRTLGRLLRQHEYQVTSAPRGDGWREALGGAPPDLLILEPVLGALDGWALLAELRAAPATAELPVLVVADDAVPAARLAALRLSPDDVVRRPLRTADLLERVRCALRAARRSDDRAQADLRQHDDVVDIFRRVAGRGSLDEMLRVTVRRLARGLRIARCSVLHMDGPGGRAVVVAASDNPALARHPVALADYPEVVEAFASGAPVLARDEGGDPVFAAARACWAAKGVPVPVRSMGCLRYQAHGRPAGVFLLRTTREAPLEPADLRFLGGVVGALEGPLAVMHGRAAAVPA